MRTVERERSAGPVNGIRGHRFAARRRRSTTPEPADGPVWGPTADDEAAAASVYVTAPYRPAVQMAIRVALWAAVGLGCVGGVVGLLGLGADEAEPVAVVPEDSGTASVAVPAPVAGTAELAVQAWLTATEEDQEDLEELFVEPVAPATAEEGSSIDVRRLTTIAGHLIEDGYWVVTVQADVVESFDGQAQPPAAWFVELGVVGDVGGDLAALSTPGVMPSAPASPDGWQSSRPTLERPSDADPVATTVESFLDALLAGQADPTPYMAPDADIPMASTPPFVEVAVVGIATQEQDNGDLDVWVDVQATSPAGRQQPVAYQLVVSPRADRWEIAALWGAPSLGSTPDESS
jgi:hypothetical protein